METEVRAGLVLRPAVSVGVAVSPEDGDSYEHLLTAADRRMYEDKQERHLLVPRDARRAGRARATA